MGAKRTSQVAAVRARPRVAEFFAGIGLVRLALENAGYDVVFANDIDPVKEALYTANFGSDELLRRDIKNVTADDVPDCDLATASFPCTDLSLAGNRVGLAGNGSSVLWEFVRVLREMGDRRPGQVLIENVPGFLSSYGGSDLESAIAALNSLGYCCDIALVDARHFVPQSRQRLFVLGSLEPVRGGCGWTDSSAHTPSIIRFVEAHPSLEIVATLAQEPPTSFECDLALEVEDLDESDPRWWTGDRRDGFYQSLSRLQEARLSGLASASGRVYATAYRRRRGGQSRWEIRADGLSGCLRAYRGGSSRQALVSAGSGSWAVRWMTAKEYARLQGAPQFIVPPAVSEARALSAFGDAVCVPVVEWVAKNWLVLDAV